MARKRLINRYQKARKKSKPSKKKQTHTEVKTNITASIIPPTDYDMLNQVEINPNVKICSGSFVGRQQFMEEHNIRPICSGYGSSKILRAAKGIETDELISDEYRELYRQEFYGNRQKAYSLSIEELFKELYARSKTTSSNIAFAGWLLNNIAALETLFQKTYHQLCDMLLSYYGAVSKDYYVFEKDKVVRNEIEKPKLNNQDGLIYIHHIDEDKCPNLSEVEVAKTAPREYQQANHLVFCNAIEHILLHTKIYLECGYPFGISGLLFAGMLRSLPYDTSVGLKVIELLYQKSIAEQDGSAAILWKGLLQLYEGDNFDSALSFPSTHRFELKRQEQQDVHDKIISEYPVGITKITGLEYRQYFKDTKHIKLDQIVYILRTPHDATACCYINNQGEVVLIESGKRKKVGTNDVQYLYDNLDTIVDFYSVWGKAIVEWQQEIKEKLQLFFPNSDYNCHGLLMDVDSERRIAFDIFRKRLVYYSATPQEYDAKTVVYYPTIQDLISEYKLLSDKNLPAIISDAHYLPDNIHTQSNISFSYTKITNTPMEEIYSWNKTFAIGLIDTYYSHHLSMELKIPLKAVVDAAQQKKTMSSLLKTVGESENSSC